eukprot:TRINITY_DN1307_c0_g3_i1.p1 TRINITY_DN1307_c0_g3~~TRINITY_DN1307_c0_g3_i1.p1  ORF type:complete len:581 (-),score=76.73 TRINITY_DN1307_c0_g3_i1:343-2085(-)
MLKLLFCIFLISIVFGQNINISDCASLGNIITNNLTVYYSLTNNIDCTGYNNIYTFGNTTIYFQGTFDGQGFSIINYTLVGNTSYLGLFGNGKSARVMNLTFLNVNITSTTSNDYVGALFGFCGSCIVRDILMNTTSPTISNIINVNMDFAGALIGYFTGNLLSNIFVQNSIVNAPSHTAIGGIIGQIIGGNLTNCHNLGFPSNQSIIIVNGGFRVGGLSGTNYGAGTTNCGVRNGVVFNSGTHTGGLFGSAQESSISNCYVKSSVSVQGGTSVGGFIGYFFCLYGGPCVVNNTYSRANVSGSTLGGLIGQVNTDPNNFLAFQNSYSSNIFNGTNIGSSLGQVSIADGNCTISNVYYDNSTSSYPASANNFGNCSDGTLPVGLNCIDLYSSVLTFDQTIWAGNNLLTEYPFSYGVCVCPSTSPSTLTPSTIPPSTLVPSTTEPSTLTPSTLIPSTGEPSTTPSTLFPTTISPSTFTCLYKVPNCQNCAKSGIEVDASQFNISCILKDNVWGYIFQPLFFQCYHHYFSTHNFESNNSNYWGKFNCNKNSYIEWIIDFSLWKFRPNIKFIYYFCCFRFYKKW